MRRCALPIVVIEYFKDVVEGVGDTQIVGRGESTLMSRMDAREDPCVGRRPGRGYNALAAPEGLSVENDLFTSPSVLIGDDGVPSF